MEHILCTHIRGHLDRHRILTPLNHGFRSRHSCETQLLLTSHDLLTQREAAKQVDVAVLDFSKAFDTVPHKRLLGKLQLYGITGDVHRWIGKFLTGRKQRVIVDGEKSEEVDVLSGVPQGTVLGPLLFLLHINDLPSAVHPDTKCRLFADDCLLYRTVSTTQDQLQLQRDLQQLEDWATDWGMKLNASKCHIMAIHRGREHSPFMYQLGGTIMSTVLQEKYLGVLVSHDLSWDPHISSVATAANQKLGFLMRNLKGSPKNLKKTAYISMVRSSLEYAAVVWDPHLSKHKYNLEKTQRKAARWICSDYGRQSSVTRMLEQLSIEPLEDRRRASRLTFLYKILNDRVALSPSDLGLVYNSRATRGLATQQKLIVPYCATTELKNHFAARTIPEWNRLPQATTSADSVSAFKSRLAGGLP